MVGCLTSVCQKHLDGECWLTKHLKSEEVEELCREAFSKLRGALIGSLILFLYPFIFWPGFGSTIFWSPLDTFLLRNYPLWFLVAFPFALGFLSNILPAVLGVRLYLYKTYLMEIGSNKNLKYFLMLFASASISIFPAWVMLFTGLLKNFNFLRYNFLEYILMTLAWIKGYQGQYYRGGYTGNIFGGSTFSGALLSVAIIFLREWLKLKNVKEYLNKITTYTHYMKQRR